MEKLEENIKKTNLTIGKTLKKLDRELISLEREFNWLMRQHYQEYSVDSDSNKYSENKKLDKKNTCEKITKKLDRIAIDRKDDLKGNSEGKGKGKGKGKDNDKDSKISIDSKRTKKKKRVIVWNAWVIDTSSESESDMEDMDDRSVNDRFICSSSDSDSD